MPRALRQGRNEGAYRFKIDAYTPAKFPMARLAEYMQELAQMLGQPTQVHFAKLTKGSTVLNMIVDAEAIPKTRDRIAGVKSGGGPGEAVRAYSALNKMLRDDNAIGTLRAGAVVLAFPGKDEAQEEFASVRQQGFVDGVIKGVRGRDETVHITLLAEGRQISGCRTNRTIAKQLAAKFDEAVRLYGRGRWQRDSDGSWLMADFIVESFEQLDGAPLADALADLRALPMGWVDEAYPELGTIRHGSRSGRNGSN